MPYINKVDINGVEYTLENLTDGNHLVALPTLSGDDTFVLRGDIVDGASSTSTTKPLSANQGKLLRDDLTTEINRALDAEETLTNNLAAEIERATKAETDLVTTTNNIGKLITSLAQNKVDKSSNKGLSTNDYTTDEKNKLAGIEAGANKYTHPSHTDHQSGLYKVAVDSSGHVSGATSVTKSDITGLGIPAQDTTYSIATSTSNGLLSASDKEKYDAYDGRIKAGFEPDDYIVEQGTSNSWTYRKWNSGISECWGRIEGNLAPAEADSGIAGFLVFSGSYGFPSGLFIEDSVPIVTYNGFTDNGYFLPVGDWSSTYTQFKWTAFVKTASAARIVIVNAKAYGRWK